MPTFVPDPGAEVLIGLATTAVPGEYELDPITINVDVQNVFTVDSALSFDLDEITINVEPQDLNFPVPTTPVPTPAGQPTEIDIWAVDTNGARFHHFGTADLKKITWTLNGPEVAEFEIPLGDAAQLPVPNSGTTPVHEVQIYRNGHLLFWGLPTDRRADSANRTWSYTARGFLWAFGRRFHGDPNRTDFLGGIGNFEGTDLTQWTTVGTMTVTSETVFPILLDDKSAKLVSIGTPQEKYIYKQFVIAGGAIGAVMFATGWVYIQAVNTPPIKNIGLWIASGTPPNRRESVTKIDAQAPVNGWRRLSAQTFVFPNENAVVEIRLYCPVVGTVFWDAVTITALDSDSFRAENSPGGTGWDEVEIGKGIIQVAQGLGPFAYPQGQWNQKSYLGVQWAGAPSGVIKERTYQHADHNRVYGGGAGTGSLDEFSKASDGYDYRIEITPTSKVWTAYYPQVGVTRDDIEFIWTRDVDTDGNLEVEQVAIAKWDYGESIVNSSNQVVELGGWGSGAGREEGGYTNSASLGGLTLELVEGAPNGTPIDLLDAVAEERGAQLENPVFTPSFSLYEPRDLVTNEVTYPLIGVLFPGDICTFRVSDGEVQLDGTYRLSRVVYDAETEILDVTPNTEPE